MGDFSYLETSGKRRGRAMPKKEILPWDRLSQKRARGKERTKGINKERETTKISIQPERSLQQREGGITKKEKYSSQVERQPGRPGKN